MSAYIVCIETVQDAVAFLVDEGHVHAAEADDLGRRLWEMNVDAVSQRYAHHAETDGAHWERVRQKAKAFRFRRDDVSFEQRVKSAGCLSYQCAEGDVPERPLFKLLKTAADVYWKNEAWVARPAFEAAEWGRCG